MTKHFTSSRTKRITIQGLLAASVVGLGIVGAMTQTDPSNPAEAAQAQEQPAESVLDPLTYSRVQQVRRESGLGNEDLALLGLTDSEASSVLTRLARWCEANEAAITQAQQAVSTARRDLREQHRLVRIGQASQRQLSDAGSTAKALADAQAAYDGLLDRGATHAIQAPGVGSFKVSAWQNASTLNSKIGTDLRYLPGMDADRLTSLRSEAKRRDVGLERALSASEQQQLTALRDQARASLPGVLVAEAAALPVPEELRGEAWLPGEPGADPED